MQETDKIVFFVIDWSVQSNLLCFLYTLFLFLSCAVRQTETSGPPAVIRRRRSWRKPGRWLPRHCHRGLAPTALPSTVWPEGSQWGRARADWRLPQDTLPRYGKSTQTCYDHVGQMLKHIDIYSWTCSVSLNRSGTNPVFECITFVYIIVSLCSRFPPGALPCGARTTAVPWKTGHSHGQDPARLGGVS